MKQCRHSGLVNISFSVLSQWFTFYFWFCRLSFYALGGNVLRLGVVADFLHKKVHSKDCT